MAIAKYKERLLDEFEAKTDEWGYGAFERRLGEIRKGTSYHDAKGIINDAYKDGRWPNTVKRYLLTNFKAHGNVSSELNNTFNQVCESMSQDEKEVWGLNSNK